MLTLFYVCIFIGMLFAVSLGTRYALKNEHDDLLNPSHLAVTLYCSVNIMICCWEIILFFYRKQIQDTFAGYKKKLEMSALPSPLFLLENISLGQALSSEYWHDVWATYSLLDISYSQHGSFGFNIDVCNGFSTILPSIAFLFGATEPRLLFGASPRVFGFVSALFFYQAFYGTVVYFFQYCLNQRWRDHRTPKFHIAALVLPANGFWIVGGLFSLYTSYRMVIDDSVNVFFE